MANFKNLSIRHKLTTIIVLTSGLMILITSLILIINESITLRRTAERNIAALTERYPVLAEKVIKTRESGNYKLTRPVNDK